MKGPQPNLALRTPSATVERHGPELLALCGGLDRLGLRDVAMTREQIVHTRTACGRTGGLTPTPNGNPIFIVKHP